MAVANVGAGGVSNANTRYPWPTAGSTTPVRTLGQDIYAPIPVPPPPKGEDEYHAPNEGLLKKAESVAGDALAFLGNFGPLRWLGYKFLDLIQPIKNTSTIGNLGQVDTNLYRGEQLGPKGFATLKQMGVKTVINLEAESYTDTQYAKPFGIKVVNIPMAPIGEMPMQQGVQFLSTVTDPASGKVYFHCYHGSDRTGAMAAIYQICVQGKSIDQAIAGMGKYGFHAGFEDSKIQFIYDFVKYWNTLPATQKAQILHQPAPVPAARP